MKLYQSRSGVRAVGVVRLRTTKGYGSFAIMQANSSISGAIARVLSIWLEGANTKFLAVFKAVRAGGVVG